MSILKGTKNLSDITGTIYGNYSFGNMYEKFFSQERSNKSRKNLEKDLSIAGLLDEIEDLDCMDVGTGRQALTLSQIGAKSVDHFDISEEHVARFSSLLKNKYKSLNISTTCLDLCKNKIPKQKYDFVYLSGIVQHFSDIKSGLKNCSVAVKKDGLLCLYFYRSGTFKWFVVEMIRQIISVDDLDRIFIMVAKRYDEDYSNDNVCCVMDDFFAPYIHLYAPIDYIRILNLYGFELHSSSHSDPLIDISHNEAHHSAVLVFKRAKVVDLTKVNDTNHLSYLCGKDQHDKKLYKDSLTLKLIDKFQEIRKNISKNQIDDTVRFSLALEMHKIAAPQYYGGSELPPKKQELLELFNKFN